MFPTPIGGTAFPVDFAPSVLFATLYGLLIPFMFYRVLHRRSRTTLLIQTLLFAGERVVIFSLRAVQAHNESRRLSKGLATYMQLSFGMGFVGIANDLVNLIRCLLVNPTYGSDTYAQSPAAATKDGDMKPPPENTPDQPRARFWARRFSDAMNILFVAATVPGILGNSQYSNVFDNQEQADKTMRYRYASSGVAMFLTFVVAGGTAWARLRFSRASKRGANLIFVLALLLTVIAVYRLSVMWHTSDSLNSTAPGTLNSNGAKATFYLFHVLPEWLTSVILLCFNIRKILGTGLVGDYRYRDETPKEREKRLKREAKREAKRHAKALVDDDSPKNTPKLDQY